MLQGSQGGKVFNGDGYYNENMEIQQNVQRY